MIDVDIPATITALSALVIAIGTLVAAVLAYLSRRASQRSAELAAVAADVSRKADAKIVEIDGKLFTLGESVDGKLSKLLDLTREAALAKGRLEGAATEKAEQAERTAEGVDGGRRNGDTAAAPGEGGT